MVGPPLCMYLKLELAQSLLIIHCVLQADFALKREKFLSFLSSVEYHTLLKCGSSNSGEKYSALPSKCLQVKLISCIFFFF